MPPQIAPHGFCDVHTPVHFIFFFCTERGGPLLVCSFVKVHELGFLPVVAGFKQYDNGGQDMASLDTVWESNLGQCALSEHFNH